MRRQGGARFVRVACVGGQIAFPVMSLHHATKWGVEGFWESAAELAPFGIDVVIVEPGMARTNFAGAGSIFGAPLPEYADGPSGQLRRVASGELPSLPTPGDPVKIAAAIIAAADRPEVPLRLTLGSDAHALATDALRDRLRALEAGRDLAHSTDADDVIPVGR